MDRWVGEVPVVGGVFLGQGRGEEGERVEGKIRKRRGKGRLVGEISRRSVGDVSRKYMNIRDR